MKATFTFLLLLFTSWCFCYSGSLDNAGDCTITDMKTSNLDISKKHKTEVSPGHEGDMCPSQFTSVAFACTATSVYDTFACVGQEVTFEAFPSSEGEANPLAETAFWVIEGDSIRLDDIGETLGEPGNRFVVKEVEASIFNNFFTIIRIEFENSGDYELEFFVDYTSCSAVTSQGSIIVNPLPSEIMDSVEEMVCYGEDVIIDLNVTGSSVYIATYEINTNQQTDTFSNISSSIIIEEVEELFVIKFISLIDTFLDCNLSEFENVYSIQPFDPISIENLEDFCVTEEGQFFSQHEILGGSGSFQFVNSAAAGEISDNVYNSDSLGIGELDTLRLIDSFCLNRVYEFPLTNSCACTDTTALFDNSNIYESCETDVIELSLLESSKSTNPSTQSILRTYEKVGSEISFIEEQLITDENNATIPYREIYTNGKNYFARTYISTLNDSGEVNYSDFCIDSSSQEIIFRFFQNPDAEVLGATEVCINQSEVLIEPSKIQSSTEYQWEIPANTEVVQQGNRLYAKFLESGNASFTLYQTYFPQNSESSLSCFGESVLDVTVTNEIAPDRSDIFFFEPNFLSIDIGEDICVQWFSIDKQTGVRLNYGTEKQWVVQGYDPEVYYYGVETKFSIDGICEFDGYCETTQFYNKGPITEVHHIEDNFDINFDVFPNPASDLLTVKLDGFEPLSVTVELYSLLGERLNVEQKVAKEHIYLDLSDCQKGLYFISIIDASQQYKTVKRIVVE